MWWWVTGGGDNGNNNDDDYDTFKDYNDDCVRMMAAVHPSLCEHTLVSFYCWSIVRCLNVLQINYC